MVINNYESSLQLLRKCKNCRYRAPELLLKQDYDFAIDIWALGCIMFELYNLVPLFPGENVNIEMFFVLYFWLNIN